jgi:hypothetical protein
VTHLSRLREKRVAIGPPEREDIPHDKGKPAERRGRKATGLRAAKPTIAGLPGSDLSVPVLKMLILPALCGQDLKLTRCRTFVERRTGSIFLLSGF